MVIRVVRRLFREGDGVLVEVLFGGDGDFVGLGKESVIFYTGFCCIFKNDKLGK